jgi:uncharacterized protein DUF6498
MLLLVNVVPIFGVFYLGWELFPLIFFYWFESFIIGIIHLLRLLLIAPLSIVLWLLKLFIIPCFYILPFVCFNFAYFIFIAVIFDKGKYLQWHDDIFEMAAQIPDTILFYDMQWMILFFLFSHLYSFIYNDYVLGYHKEPEWKKILFEPYLRIFIPGFMIITGGLLIRMLEIEVAGLLLIIVLKTAADFYAYWRQHRMINKLI